MLLILLVALGVAAVVVPVLDARLGRRTGYVLAAVFGGLAVLVGAQGPAVLGGDPLTTTVRWFPTLDVGLSLRMDGTGWLFAMLVLSVGALIMLYATRYFPAGRRLGFFLLMTVFALAMLGLVLADDVVVLYVFWELTTITSFALIGLSGEGASRAAIRTFLLTVLGGLGLLGAVVMLATSVGSTQLSVILSEYDPTASPGHASAVALLMVLAAFTKSAQFPFHYWLPDAMVASTPVSAYLHAAAMVKAGIYLLMRFTPLFGEMALWTGLLVCVGLVTAVLGAVFALQRTDLKELLAYSTVSQLGLLVAVIGVGTPAALSAAAVHVIAHGLFKSALFMLVGVIDVQTGTRDIRRLAGLRRSMPVTATVVVVAAASMAGLPPLLGFVSKESVFGALLELPGPAWAGPVAGGVAVAASALTFAYSFRIVAGTLPGRAPTDLPAREAGAVFLAGPAVAALAGLGLGLSVAALDPLVDAVVLDTTLQEGATRLTLWHGVNTPLLMSAVAIGTGAVLARRRRGVGRALDRRLFPVTGPGAFEAIHRTTIRWGARVGDLTRTDQPAPYLATLFGAVLVVGVGTALAQPDLGPVHAPTARALDWPLVALIAVAVAAVVTTRTRLAALALVGIAGFGVALWFVVLGGYDLAFTQLLVEILTVVIAVLVLRRLPRRFAKPSVRRRSLAGTLAVASGLTAGVGAYAFIGRRDLSRAAEHMLTHAEEETGGVNVVNTILVDYRALDTLGELTVLGVAGLVIIGVLSRTRLNTERIPQAVTELRGSPVFAAGPNAVIAQTVSRFIMPVLVAVSAVLVWRGHNEPGGGFIGALVAGAAFALVHLAAPGAGKGRIRLPYTAIIAAGVATAAGAGLLGYVRGSYLAALHVDVLGSHLTTALVFDVGVYLAVVGVVLTALDKLGAEDDIAAQLTATEGARR